MSDEDGNDAEFPHEHPLNVEKLNLPEVDTVNSNVLKICNDENMTKELQQLANQMDEGMNTQQMTTLLFKLIVVTSMATNHAASHIELTKMVHKFEQKALNLQKAITAILQLKQQMFDLTDEVLHVFGKNETTNEYKTPSKSLTERIKLEIEEISEVETFYCTSFTLYISCHIYIYIVIKPKQTRKRLCEHTWTLCNATNHKRIILSCTLD